MRAYNESLEGERRRAKRGRSFKRGRLSENTARTILAEKKAWTDLFFFKGLLGQNTTYADIADPLSSWALRRRVNTLLTRPLNSPVMNVAEQRVKARLSSPPPLAARCYKQLNKRAGHERAPRKFMRRAGGSIRACKDHATCTAFSLQVNREGAGAGQVIRASALRPAISGHLRVGPDGGLESRCHGGDGRQERTTMPRCWRSEGRDRPRLFASCNCLTRNANKLVKDTRD